MTLADWMTERSLTDEAFAALIGCNRATISRLRRGITWPTSDTAARIKEVTNSAVTPDDFLSALSQSA